MDPLENRQNEFDIKEALATEVTNIICIEENKMNIELAAQAFYDIYLK